MHIVLGGTGHVGSATASALLARGEAVTIVTRNGAAASTWKRRGAEVAVADVKDSASLRQFFKRGTRLFVLSPPADPATDVDAVEHVTIQNILAALEGSGLEKLVVLSTYGAHSGERCGDLTTLHALEAGVRAQAIPSTIIRAAYYMSNWDFSLDSARQDGTFQTFFRPTSNCQWWLPKMSAFWRLVF